MKIVIAGAGEVGNLLTRRGGKEKIIMDLHGFGMRNSRWVLSACFLLLLVCTAGAKGRPEEGVERFDRLNFSPNSYERGGIIRRMAFGNDDERLPEGLILHQGFSNNLGGNPDYVQVLRENGGYRIVQKIREIAYRPENFLELDIDAIVNSTIWKDSIICEKKMSKRDVTVLKKLFHHAILYSNKTDPGPYTENGTLTIMLDGHNESFTVVKGKDLSFSSGKHAVFKKTPNLYELRKINADIRKQMWESQDENLRFDPEFRFRIKVLARKFKANAPPRK